MKLSEDLALEIDRANGTATLFNDCNEAIELTVQELNELFVMVAQQLPVEFS